MPNIEQINLTPEQVAIRPSELGVEAAVQAGRRIGTFAHQLGENVAHTVGTVGMAVVKHDEDMEKSHLLDQFTQADMQDDQDRRSFLNLPENQNNPYAAMEYYEKYSKPRYDAILASAKTDAGKSLAQQLYDRSVRGSFDHSATISGAVASATHVTAVMNRQGYYNSRITDDPSSVDQARAGFAAEIAATRPSMADPTRAAEEDQVLIREANKDFAHTYYNTVLNRMYEGAAAGRDISGLRTQFDNDIASHRFAEDMGGDWSRLTTEADDRIERGQSALAADQERQHRADIWNGQATMKNFMDELRMGPGGVLQTPSDWRQRVLADTHMQPEEKNSLLEMQERMSHGDNRSTDGLMNSLLQRALLPDTDPNHLTDQQLFDLVDKPGDQHISKDDADFIYHRMHPTDREGFAERYQLVAGLDFVKSTLGIKDNIGIPPSPGQMANFSAFENWFMPAYQAGLNRGIPASRLLGQDPRDPEALLTPAHIATFNKPDTAGPAPGAVIAPAQTPQPNQGINWDAVRGAGSRIISDITNGGQQRSVPGGGVQVPIDQAAMARVRAQATQGQPPMSQDQVNGILFGGR